MVTISLAELLRQKKWYNETYPGGRETMLPAALAAYQNLVEQITLASQRAQTTLPGLENVPVMLTGGQIALF